MKITYKYLLIEALFIIEKILKPLKFVKSVLISKNTHSRIINEKNTLIVQKIADT